MATTTKDQTRQDLPGMIAAEFVEVPLHQIEPDARNPRSDFSEAKLRKLAESMQADSTLQPILLRSSPPGAERPYRIVFGERRYRAAELAGWASIPARIVKAMSDRKSLELMGVENLQRARWNALEVAEYFHMLADEGLSTKRIARLVGRSVNNVRDHLLLTELPPEWQSKLARGEISFVMAARVAEYADRPAVLEAFAEDLANNPDDWRGRGLNHRALLQAIASRVEQAESPGPHAPAAPAEAIFGDDPPDDPEDDPQPRATSATATARKAAAPSRPETLEALHDWYINERGDVKETTKAVRAQSVRLLGECFGEDRSLATLTEADLEEFERYIADRGYAAGTIRTHVSNAQVVLREAGVLPEKIILPTQAAINAFLRPWKDSRPALEMIRDAVDEAIDQLNRQGG